MNSTSPEEAPLMTNGSGAAAVLAAGIGSFVLGLLAFAGDKSAAVKHALVFYKPTGALSGVTTLAIVVWLLAWAMLDWRWRGKTLAMSRIAIASMTLLAISFALTFPPVVDLL